MAPHCQHNCTARLSANKNLPTPNVKGVFVCKKACLLWHPSLIALECLEGGAKMEGVSKEKKNRKELETREVTWWG